MDISLTIQDLNNIFNEVLTLIDLALKISALEISLINRDLPLWGDVQVVVTSILYILYLNNTILFLTLVMIYFPFGIVFGIILSTGAAPYS